MSTIKNHKTINLNIYRKKSSSYLMIGNARDVYSASALKR